MEGLIASQVRICVLGGFDVAGAAGTVPPRRLMRALIAALALEPGNGWSRDDLTALLWGDHAAEPARASLRQALAEARRSLGEGVLITGQDRVRFDPDRVSVDAAEFLRAAETGDSTRAAELYRGDLLEGVGLPGGAFDDWLLVERTRLSERAIQVFARLADQQTGEAAIATCQRLLRMDPYREDSHRALMRCHARLGNRALALRQYDLCRELLSRELGVAPDAETERLRQELAAPEAGSLPPPEPKASPPDALPATGAGTPPVPGGPAKRKLAAAVLALTLAAAAVLWQSMTPPSAVTKPLVAVLPFADLSSDPATARLARGLTEDIITDLGRVPEFQVLASDTTEVLSTSTLDAAGAGRSVNAAFVVDGSIQREGDDLRITAQLIETGNGTTIWTERWDRPAADVFAIQAEISEAVANRLGGGNGLVQETGRIAAHRKPPASLSAYDYYLLGTEKLEQVNREDLEEALLLLTRAVEIDPGFARAWLELFHTHLLLPNYGADWASHMRLADEAADRALLLDPSDPEAHAVKAMSLGIGGNIAAAQAEFETALAMAPNQFEILTFYISWASTFGEPEKGADLVDEAVRLNPNFPMWAARPYSYAYFMAGRYDEALGMTKRVDDESLGMWLWPYRAGALAALGRQEEARAAVAETLRRYPDLTIEGTVNDPGYSDAERQRLIETMRLAGFPPCAKPEALAVAEPLRLPECTAQ